MSSYKEVSKAGNIYWYKEGTRVYHREDGPAFENVDGYKSWFINGLRHREDGPACEYADGTKYWYYHGEEIKCSSQKEFIRIIKLKAFW